MIAIIIFDYKDYQLIDISKDGFASLLTKNGGTKNDFKLPTNVKLLTLIKGFAEGKDLVVSMMFAMGVLRMLSIRAKRLRGETVAERISHVCRSSTSSPLLLKPL